MIVNKMIEQLPIPPKEVICKYSNGTNHQLLNNHRKYFNNMSLEKYYIQYCKWDIVIPKIKD